jgi:hypothetical protein
MIQIHGIPIVLYERTKTGEDTFGNPEYSEVGTTVENVLVAPASEQEVLDTLTLTGRKVIYKLGIPKGDSHEWTSGTKVSFFDETFQIIGDVTQGIEDMIPLGWHKIVRVERIENEIGTE